VALNIYCYSFTSIVNNAQKLQVNSGLQAITNLTASAEKNNKKTTIALAVAIYAISQNIRRRVSFRPLNSAIAGIADFMSGDSSL
jgi:hypothetical protein